MEGLFAFFLESSFLGLLVFGERRLGRAGGHFAGGAGAVRRQLAVGLLHHLHERVHAASGRATPSAPTARSIWRTSGRSSSTRGRSRSTRTRWSRPSSPASFVMAAVGATTRCSGVHRRSRARFLRVGVIARARVERAGRVSHRRPAGQARRAASAGRASRRWRGASRAARWPASR